MKDLLENKEHPKGHAGPKETKIKKKLVDY